MRPEDTATRHRASPGATEHSTHGIATGRAETSYGGEVQEAQARGQQN
jgi:hypothetical protein